MIRGIFLTFIACSFLLGAVDLTGFGSEHLYKEGRLWIKPALPKNVKIAGKISNKDFEEVVGREQEPIWERNNVTQDAYLQTEEICHNENGEITEIEPAKTNLTYYKGGFEPGTVLFQELDNGYAKIEQIKENGKLIKPNYYTWNTTPYAVATCQKKDRKTYISSASGHGWYNGIRVFDGFTSSAADEYDSKENTHSKTKQKSEEIYGRDIL